MLQRKASAGEKGAGWELVEANEDVNPDNMRLPYLEQLSLGSATATTGSLMLL